jgi:hypothetical protein
MPAAAALHEVGGCGPALAGGHGRMVASASHPYKCQISCRVCSSLPYNLTNQHEYTTLLNMRDDADLPPTPTRLVEMFFDEVPEAFLVDTCRGLLEAYRSAFEFCTENYPRAQAHNLYPYYRLATFERNWHSLCARYDMISATAKLNAAGNYFHTAVACGRFVLTESAVYTPTTIVRQALFRKTYAESGQLLLFNEPTDPLPAAEKRIYAIILHGPTRELLREPGFVHIVFPARDCESYIEGRDLLIRYRDQHLSRVETPTAPELKRPALKPVRREADEES